MTLKRALQIFNRIYDSIGLFFLVGLIICCWLQVAARFINSLTIVWTDELAGYMMVGCCCFGSGTCARHGGHLGAFFLRDRVKGRKLGVLLAFNAIITRVVLSIFCIGVSAEMKLVGRNTAISMPWLSQKWLYIPLGLGSIYMICYQIRDLFMAFRVIRTGDASGYCIGSSSPFPAEVDEC